MRLTLLLLVIILLFCIACQAPDSPTANTTTPKTDSLPALVPRDLPRFTAPDNLFRAYFPSIPQRFTRQSQVDIGELAMTQWVAYDDSGQYYVVSYADYPSGVLKLGSDQQLLKGVEERLLSALHARQTSRQTMQLYGQYPAIAFQAQAKRQHWFLNYHLYLVNNRVYQLGIHSALGPIPKQDSTDFFTTFELIKR